MFFFADLHLTANALPIFGRVAHWAAEEIRLSPSEDIVFGGDMLQRSEPAAAAALFDQMGTLHEDCWWLPGNRDADGSIQDFMAARAMRPIDSVSSVMINGCQVLMLNTANQKLPKLTASHFKRLDLNLPLVVLTHIPITSLDADTQSLLTSVAARQYVRPTWIAGHDHADQDLDVMGWRMVITRGLDPFRAQRGRPSYLKIDLPSIARGHHGITRVTIPEAVLFAPAARTIHLGIAVKGDPVATLKAAEAKGITAVQLYAENVAETPDAAIVAVHQWRESLSGTHLALHLPTPDAGHPAEVDAALGWAEQAGVREFVSHLPLTDVSNAFVRNTPPLPGAQIHYLATIARRAAKMGATLRLENIHNPADQASTGAKDLGSVRQVAHI